MSIRWHVTVTVNLEDNTEVNHDYRDVDLDDLPRILAHLGNGNQCSSLVVVMVKA